MSTQIIDVPLDHIEHSPTNPRKYFNPDKLKEMANSILAVGVIQAVTLRPHPKQKSKFELVCGERRYRGSQIAKKETIPAVVKNLTDEEVQELQFIENIEREDVHPMDEAVTFKAMLDNKAKPWTIEDIAAKITKPVSYVAQRLQLNNLIPALQKEFWDEKFLIGHAILFARLQHDDQKRITSHHNIKNNGTYTNIKNVDDWIRRNIMHQLSAAPFNKEDANLVSTAGACLTCVKRTGGNAALFPEMKNDDRCLDGKCFGLKCQAGLLLQVEETLSSTPEVHLISKGDVPGPIRKMAEKYKVHIINYFNNGITEHKVTGYTAIKALWVNTDKAGKIATIYRQMAGKAKVEAKIAAGEKLTAADIDQQIAGINDRLKRGTELDAEKVWEQISEFADKPGNFKKVDFASKDYTTAEKNAGAFALLLAIDGSEYKKMAAEIIGIDNKQYFDVKNTVDKIKDITDEKLRKLFRLFVLSTLNTGSSHKSSATAAMLYRMLNQDKYLKVEIEQLEADQQLVCDKRETNAQKRIKALEEQKKLLKQKKEKPAAVKKAKAAVNKKTSTKTKKAVA